MSIQGFIMNDEQIIRKYVIDLKAISLYNDITMKRYPKSPLKTDAKYGFSFHISLNTSDLGCFGGEKQQIFL
mgnify:CR=1 FL=1